MLQYSGIASHPVSHNPLYLIFPPPSTDICQKYFILRQLLFLSLQKDLRTFHNYIRKGRTVFLQQQKGVLLIPFMQMQHAFFDWQRPYTVIWNVSCPVRVWLRHPEYKAAGYVRCPSSPAGSFFCRLPYKIP